MVEVSVGQQHAVQSAKPQFGAYELALSALAAIDQKAIRAFREVQRWQAALGRRHRGSGSEKHQLEHDKCQADVIIWNIGVIGRLAPPKRGVSRPDFGEESR